MEFSLKGSRRIWNSNETWVDVHKNKLFAFSFQKTSHLNFVVFLKLCHILYFLINHPEPLIRKISPMGDALSPQRVLQNRRCLARLWFVKHNSKMSSLPGEEGERYCRSSRGPEDLPEFVQAGGLECQAAESCCLFWDCFGLGFFTFLFLAGTGHEEFQNVPQAWGKGVFLPWHRVRKKRKEVSIISFVPEKGTTPLPQGPPRTTCFFLLALNSLTLFCPLALSS